MAISEMKVWALKHMLRERMLAVLEPVLRENKAKRNELLAQYEVLKEECKKHGRDFTDLHRLVEKITKACGKSYVAEQGTAPSHEGHLQSVSVRIKRNSECTVLVGTVYAPVTLPSALKTELEKNRKELDALPREEFRDNSLRDIIELLVSEAILTNEKDLMSQVDTLVAKGIERYNAK